MNNGFSALSSLLPLSWMNSLKPYVTHSNPCGTTPLDISLATNSGMTPSLCGICFGPHTTRMTNGTVLPCYRPYLGFCPLCFYFPTKMLHLNAPFFHYNARFSPTESRKMLIHRSFYIFIILTFQGKTFQTG